MECNVYSQIDSDQRVDQNEIEKVVERILKELDQDGELSIHKIGDEKMKQLNKEYRDIDRTTDVLSFSMQEGEQFTSVNDLGDVFISVPQIKRQAKEQGVSIKEEFKRILIHGILHLLGYDHQKEEESERMFSLQERLLNEVR